MIELTKDEIKTTGCVPEGEHAGIWINTFGDKEREKLPDQIIEHQTIVKRIEETLQNAHPSDYELKSILTELLGRTNR